jgi:hypothetical protein
MWRKKSVNPNGCVELVDGQGNRVGVIRRPPSDDEIAFAKSRIGSNGPRLTIDEVIAKVEAVRRNCDSKGHADT